MEMAHGIGAYDKASHHRHTNQTIFIQLTMASAAPASPNEILNFNILASSAAVLSPRLGRLTIAGRKPISTPHYVPLTSRGAVPHLAHDVMRDNTSIGSLFVGLEDCTRAESDD